MEKKFSLSEVLLIIFALAAVAGAGYLYLQNRTLKSSVAETSPTPAVTASAAPAATGSAAIINASIMPAVTATPAPKPKTVVVFEAAGSFSASEKSELQKKIIDPYVDYYLETSGVDYLVSLTIEKNNNAATNKDYPYSLTGIFNNGGNNGALIHATNGVIDWWTPECMKCEFSDSYKQKYPEVVAPFNN